MTGKFWADITVKTATLPTVEMEPGMVFEINWPSGEHDASLTVLVDADALYAIADRVRDLEAMGHIARREARA